MAATTVSAALMPVGPVFSNTGRLTLGGFRAGYGGLSGACWL
jgi:hypothetical protein